MTGLAGLTRFSLRRSRLLVLVWTAVLVLVTYASAAASKTLYASGADVASAAHDLNSSPGAGGAVRPDPRRAQPGRAVDDQDDGHLRDVPDGLRGHSGTPAHPRRGGVRTRRAARRPRGATSPHRSISAVLLAVPRHGADLAPGGPRGHRRWPARRRVAVVRGVLAGSGPGRHRHRRRRRPAVGQRAHLRRDLGSGDRRPLRAAGGGRHHGGLLAELALAPGLVDPAARVVDTRGVGPAARPRAWPPSWSRWPSSCARRRDLGSGMLPRAPRDRRPARRGWPTRSLSTSGSTPPAWPSGRSRAPSWASCWRAIVPNIGSMLDSAGAPRPCSSVWAVSGRCRRRLVGGVRLRRRRS